MSLTQMQYWFWLCSIEGCGPASLFPLLARLGSPQALFCASREEVLAAKVLKTKQAESFFRSRDEERVKRAYDHMQKLDIRLIPCGSAAWPHCLDDLYDRPLGLFVKGSVPYDEEWRIAMVGARHCGAYGLEVTHMIARGLAVYGTSVVSGLARGADSASHRGCLDGGGTTYAVLGCGPDICYPADNISLYQDILDSGGGILSEYPPGTRPAAWRFPMRNRIIAAVSRAVVVTQAQRKSGSLITAERGLELGREIFAVPGRIDDPLSEGCNDLIRSGAGLAAGPADILNEFGIAVHAQDRDRDLHLSGVLSAVYHAVTLVPCCADDICAGTGISPAGAAGALVELERRGLIFSIGKGQYILRK